MSETDDARTRFEHVSRLFRPQLLRAVRADLELIAPVKQARATTERERRALERGESSDALRLDPRWFDVWRDPEPGLLAAIRPYTWVVYPPQVRFVRAESHRVPWHQDAGYQRLLGARGHRHHVTCFIPLDDDPARRTTLEFARSGDTELTHVPRDGFGAGIVEPPEGERVHYQLALGDALVFGDLVLHRTFVPRGAEIERRSFEFRLIRPEDALAEKDYFDVEAGRFRRQGGAAQVAS